MIFGFGKRKREKEDKDENAEEELDFVLFQGAMNGQNPDLAANAKLAQAGLVPAKRLVSEALSRRAEMVRLEVKGNVAAAMLHIDGVVFPGQRMPAQMALAITQMLKLLAGLDIKVRNKAQAGGINATYKDAPYEVRINVQPVQGGGERLIIRMDNIKNRIETPKDLGFSDSLIENIRDITSSRSGLILVAGPPMSGVTTAAIATVRATDAYLYSIYCLADLGGRELSHINMYEWNPEDDLRATMMRAKREDADVLYIDPISNKETAQTALEMAESLCVIAEMPAKDAADAVARLVHLVGDPKLVAGSVRLVLNQMLIRVLCKKCRRAYRPNAKLLARVGLPPETQVLYRHPAPGGEGTDPKATEEEICKTCGGIGYMGRTGLMEALQISDGIKKIILSGADPKAIRAQARSEKMQTVQSDALRVVADGTTSLEELQRAFKSSS